MSYPPQVILLFYLALQRCAQLGQALVWAICAVQGLMRMRDRVCNGAPRRAPENRTCMQQSLLTCCLAPTHAEPVIVSHCPRRHVQLMSRQTPLQGSTLCERCDALHVPDEPACLHHDGVICAANSLRDLRTWRMRILYDFALCGQSSRSAMHIML